MEGILDDSRLNGVCDVGTALRPLRRAELVPAGDLDILLERIEFNSQVWGGGGTVFVPSLFGTEGIRSLASCAPTAHGPISG